MKNKIYSVIATPIYRGKQSVGMTLIILLLSLISALQVSAQDSTKITDMTADTSPVAAGVFYYIESATDKQITWGTMTTAVKDTVKTTTGDVTLSGDPLVSAIGTGKVTTTMILDGTIAAVDIATSLDTNLVKTTGSDNIYGNKTFINSNTFNGDVSFNGNISSSGNNTFNGDNTFNGAVDLTDADYLRLGTVGSGALGGTIYYIDQIRDLIAYMKDDSGTADTVASYFYTRENYIPLSGGTFTGSVTFSDAITQQEVIHQGYESVTVTTSTLSLNGNTNHYEVTLPAGAKTITSFSVSDVARGDIIFISNSSSSAMTLNDSFPLNLTVSFVMGEDDNILLYYDGNTYNEISRSNN